MKYILPLILCLALLAGCQKDDSLSITTGNEKEETTASLLIGKWNLDFLALFENPDDNEEGILDHLFKMNMEFKANGTLIMSMDFLGIFVPIDLNYELMSDNKTIKRVDSDGEESFLTIVSITKDRLVLEEEDWEEDGDKAVMYFHRVK